MRRGWPTPRIASRHAVCDLAAGTGKLTRLLVADRRRPCSRSSRVAGHARRRSGASCPAIPWSPRRSPRRCRSRDASLDAVVVAQAFHWFDAAAALARARAASLRPGGRTRPRLERVGPLGRLGRPHPVDRGPGREATPVARSHWTGLGRRARSTTPAGSARSHEATFRHEQVLTPERVVDRIASTSHVASASDRERARRPRRRCATVLDDDPALAAAADARHSPTGVDAYWCERP